MDSQKFGVFNDGYLVSPSFDTEKDAKIWAEENGYHFDDDHISIEEVYEDEDDDDWERWCEDHPLPGDDCIMLGL